MLATVAACLGSQRIFSVLPSVLTNHQLHLNSTQPVWLSQALSILAFTLLERSQTDLLELDLLINVSIVSCFPLEADCSLVYLTCQESYCLLI